MIAEALHPRTILSFEVPGLPEPQGSARGFNIGGKVRITSDNRKLRSWRREVVLAAREVWSEDPLARAVRVSAVFLFPRPQSHSGRRGLLPSAPAQKTTKPDLDKLARALLDALMVAGVLADDSLVVELAVRKGFGLASTRVVIREPTA